MEFVTSSPGSDPIVVEAHFTVPPNQVFEAWTNPDSVMQWFGLAPNSLHSARIDLIKGGEWQFLKSKDDVKSVGFEGKYLDIQPDKRLVFSWSMVTVFADGAREATPPSRVDIQFSASGNGTDVRLVHSTIDSEALSLGFGRGWNIAFRSLLDLLSQ